MAEEQPKKFSSKLSDIISESGDKDVEVCGKCNDICEV
jgi:hypothetical protein